MNRRILGVVVLMGLSGCSLLPFAPGFSSPSLSASPSRIAPSLTPTAAATATPPALSQEELFRSAFSPGIVPNQPYNRLVHGNPIDWPEMRFLGESALLKDRTLTPTEIRIVPGKQSLLAYSPYLDEWIDADHLVVNNHYTYHRPFASISLFIPPGATLVMVHLQLDPSAGHWDPELGTVCDEEDYDGPVPTALQLSYPGLGEHSLPDSGSGCNQEFCPYHFAEFTQPPYPCPYTGWYYFYLPTLEVDPSLLWLTYVSQDELAFWTLTGRP